MIRISGLPFQQSDMWPSGSIENYIIQQMIADTITYNYQSIGELSFELKLRKNIILSAKTMSQSGVSFERLADSRCNPRYWNLTSSGGFMLKYGLKPSDAIQDIFTNGTKYGFECATAMIIIYYHAVLNVLGETLFNQLFQNIYLYSWHADSDLGIYSTYSTHYLPGDIVYFNNPDFNPQTPYWRGENAVVLGDGTYFGHGLGIKTANQMIQALNQTRKQGSNQTAYLTNIVTKPSFKHLAKLSLSQPGEVFYKHHQYLVHHDESSIPAARFVV